jgi:hypothetical protein
VARHGHQWFDALQRLSPSDTGGTKEAVELLVHAFWCWNFRLWPPEWSIFLLQSDSNAIWIGDAAR